MRNDEFRLQTVDRALTLLSYLNENDGPHQLRELAAGLGLDKAVLHRLLRTMMGHAYVVQDPDSAAYRLGPRAHALGRHADPADLFAVAREPMRTLTRETGFSTFLTLPLARDTVCVDRAEAQTTVRVSYEIGRRLPYHAGAPGKVLLASFAAPRRSSTLGDRLLERFTPATIVSRADLEGELERIRRTGYATSTGEIEDNISGVATIVRDANGEPAAALSISGLSAILRDNLFHTVGLRLLRTARSISAELGAPVDAEPSASGAEKEMPC